MRWVELCAGGAAPMLRLLGGPDTDPVVSWMGGKRRQASAILAAMGVDEVDSVVLADPGPWGWVWPILLEPRTAMEVCAALRIWEREDPARLWDGLRCSNPEDEEDLSFLVATWLVLQAGNYMGKPVTIRGGRWTTDGFARPSIAAQSKSGSCFSVERIRTAVARLPKMPRWSVINGDAGIVLPRPGSFVYIDPPYQGRTGYGWDLSREKVIRIARRWSAEGCVVAISEAEPLELEGWHTVDLTPCGRKGSGPEWLTMNREPAVVPARQIGMFA